MFEILMGGVTLYGFVVGVSSRSARRFTKWFAGILGVVIALGVLLCVTSPAATGGAWFTMQQVIGGAAVLLSIGAFGAVYFIFGVVGIISFVARQFSSSPAAAPRLMNSVDGTIRPL